VTEQRNAKRVADAIDAFNAGGFAALDPFLADDIVWFVGGNHPLSGVYRGRQAVRDYHRKAAEMCDEALQIEPVIIVSSNTCVAAFVNVRGRRGDCTLDVAMTEAIALDQDGQWTEFRALSDGQDKLDAFWSEPIAVGAGDLIGHTASL
jgi:ketosteroid isomerase-like protein